VSRFCAVAAAAALPALLAGGCVLDRTGQSRPYQMYQSIEDNRMRIEVQERSTANLDTRIVKMREEERAYREAVAESGANLEGLLENINALRGQVQSLRDEVRERGARDEQVDFRLLDIEARLDQLSDYLRSMPVAEGGTPFDPQAEPGDAGEGSAPTEVEGAAGSDRAGSPPSAEWVGGSSQPDARAAPAADTPPDAAEGPEPAAEGSAPQGDPPPAEPEPEAQPGVTQGAEEPASSAASTPAASAGAADDLAFAAALEFYRDKDWSKAGRAFASFVGRHPESPHAAEASLLRADCLYQMARYNGAIAAYQVVIDEWPSRPQASRATYMQGMCFEAVGDPSDALIFYHEVARLYPDSEDASAARTRIKELSP
jgi:TolA-binding protein